jgi:YbbR domain-containing protein
MKDLLLRNWHLKLISLGLATVLWAEVARTPTSEIVLPVFLELENIPAQTEVFGDLPDSVQIRLRGPSSLLRTLSQQNVSFSIDMKDATLGEEKVVALTPDLVHAPFGVDVVRVNPSSVRLTVEQTAARDVKVVPVLSGAPAQGFEIESTVIHPETVQVEGPVSHIRDMETIKTSRLNVDGRKEAFHEVVELDWSDPTVQPKPGTVTVEVRIRPRSK